MICKPGVWGFRYSLCFCKYSFGQIKKHWISKLHGKVPDEFILRKNYTPKLCNMTLHRLMNEGTIQFGCQWMKPMILNNGVSLNVMWHSGSRRARKLYLIINYSTIAAFFNIRLLWPNGILYDSAASYIELQHPI